MKRTLGLFMAGTPLLTAFGGDNGSLFTTDPALPANDVVTLQDPRNNFPAQNVLPLMNKAKATGADALGAVSAKLPQKELLNVDVEQAQKALAGVQLATKWLKAQGPA
ncbi:MAG: osmoprotectant transport system substrate-binding protein [Pseudonocardiales bacterium]|nr:osmoprotectant transport system substrate-binding protein [Pseudonocardiales bacterium]